jgi:hypothetical protein
VGTVLAKRLSPSQLKLRQAPNTGSCRAWTLSGDQILLQIWRWSGAYYLELIEDDMVLEARTMKRSSLRDGIVFALRSEDGLSKGIIVVSLLLVVLAYWPTLQFDYVTQDQWRAFRYSTEPQSALERGQACLNMIPRFYTLIGRPLAWMTECIEHATVARIADFAQLRPVALAIVLATVMYLGFVLGPMLGGLAFGILAAAAMVLTRLIRSCICKVYRRRWF